MNYYAHTANDVNGKRLPECRWQPLKGHLQNVAKLAKEFARPLGMEAEAELAGLLHDLGKYRPEFQSYLRGERGRSSETQHAVFGAAVLVSHNRRLANVIASHHVGLHDRDDLN